jgi:hypothetical protein
LEQERGGMSLQKTKKTQSDKLFGFFLLQKYKFQAFLLQNQFVNPQQITKKKE